MSVLLKGIRLDSPFARFLIVGIVNTLFGYSIFAVLVFAGVHYAAALLCATVLGVLFNFKTVGTFVFRSHDNRLIFRFVATYVVVYGLNVAGVRLMTSLGADTYVAGAVMLLPTAVVSFVLNKIFVFNAKTD
jgi:putative flippase GtrA